MITKNTINKLQQIIHELNNWDELEICPAPDIAGNNYYIPYMMNDALEYYVVLEDCRTAGDFFSDYEEETIGELINEEGKTGLIIRQGNDNVFTIWFHSCRIVCQCYQYHRIGHFWIQGQEQWRQLVYIIGTIYDKQQYIGNEVCTPKEKALIPLMNFPPFLKWYPLSHTPWSLYPRTREGCRCMKQLALEAGDRHFARLISLYEKLPFPQMTKYLGNALTKRSRIPLYNLIYKKICSASGEYPPRNYGAEHNRRIRGLRRESEAFFHKKGFTGNYPHFQADGIQVYAAEEHPFTVMESENFHFRIQYMISICPNPGSGINSGFFRSRKNSGFVTKDLKDLEKRLI